MTYEWAEEALVLSREQGFTFRLAQATILRGWALVEQGQGEAGIVQIRQGVAAHRATTGVPNASYHALLAEACGKMGQIEEGLRVLEGLSGVGVYRLKGELLLTLELFLNKRGRSSKAQHRCQWHHPQTQLCDCGRHVPKCCSVSYHQWHAQ